MGRLNYYVHPSDKAIWDERCSIVHGLHSQHEKIKNTLFLEFVWSNFFTFIESLLSHDKKGAFVAWNSKAYNIEWFFKITHVVNLRNFLMPKGLDFYMDPISVIKNYKGISHDIYILFDFTCYYVLFLITTLFYYRL